MPDERAQNFPTQVRIAQPCGECIYVFLRHGDFPEILCLLEKGGAEGEPSTAVRA